MTYYASSHEKEISDRSGRRRMGVYRASSQVSQQARTTEDTRFAPCPQRRLLCPEERLRLAHVALRVSALESRLLLVQEMAHRRHLGETKRSVTRAVGR